MKKIIPLLFSLIIVQYAVAGEDVNKKDDDVATNQKILEEYKGYLGNVSDNIRNEITDYRKKVSDLNQKRIELYTNLSNSAKTYIGKEREMKGELKKNFVSNKDGIQNYQEILDKYKSFFSQVTSNTREEVVKYKNDIKIINKQKKELYNVLTQEAQQHLKKEQEFRNKLSPRQRRFLEQREHFKEGNNSMIQKDEKSNPQKK